MDIRLSAQLTAAHQTAILKYLRSPGTLSQSEWVTALAAFDALSSCLVLHEGKSQTFAQFYQEFFDRPYSSALITELLALDDVEGAGTQLAGKMGKQAAANLTSVGLQEPMNEAQRLLLAYCLYWWNAFAKGYITEITIFRDLQQSGIVFQAHDLRRLTERYSPDDLTISGLRGDIKSSTYFLHTARHYPLKHDFYIAALFDSKSRQRRRVVIMPVVAWGKIDGDTMAADLEQAAALLPQPVAVTIKGQRLIVVEYNLWKEKIRAFQKRGETND